MRRICADTLDQCRSLSSYTNLAFQRSIIVDNHFDDSSDNDHAFDYVFSGDLREENVKTHAINAAPCLHKEISISKDQ